MTKIKITPYSGASPESGASVGFDDGNLYEVAFV
jgi:hypothetical protein